MKYISMILLAVMAATALAQSARVTGPVEQYTITSYPIYGKTLEPHDAIDLTIPGFVRADAAGTATVICQGNADNEKIQLNLIAGEFVPCRVRRVYSTGTTATPLHVFY